jgi:hypothetical protein
MARTITGEDYLSDLCKREGGRAVIEKGFDAASLEREEPALCDSELQLAIQSLSIAAFQALGCSGVARVDLFEHAGRLLVTEVNTSPGSMAYHLWSASGLSFADLIDELIGIAQHEWKRRQILRNTVSLGLDKAIGMFSHVQCPERAFKGLSTALPKGSRTISPAWSSSLGGAPHHETKICPFPRVSHHLTSKFLSAPPGASLTSPRFIDLRITLC